MLRIDDGQRRARLVRRHALAGNASSVEDAVADIVVLHATDPATVYLSVMARCGAATLADVSAALYERRSLVRLLAMRRTMFVVPQALVPVIHAAAALDVAARSRKRLLAQLATLPTEPELPEHLDGWLADVEEATVAALERLGNATGAQLSAAEPRLRTAILPTTHKAYDVRRNITTQVLTVLAAEGRMVRTEPRGDWTSRHHTWQPASAWWPSGIPELSPSVARARLAEAYLRRFGPATEADLAWWAGWSVRQTRAALAGLSTAPADLGCGPGLVLADDADEVAQPPPDVALLPALDATPMGWKERGWFLPPDSSALYDNYGNVGPTVWCGGEIVGGWAVGRDGSVRTRLLVDRGREVATATDAAAAGLHARLAGATVVPSFPTPLERELRG